MIPALSADFVSELNAVLVMYGCDRMVGSSLQLGRAVRLCQAIANLVIIIFQLLFYLMKKCLGLKSMADANDHAHITQPPKG